MTTPAPLFGDPRTPAPVPQSGGAPSFFELYERELVPPLFRPWAEELVSRAQLENGASVLDVACGTGIVARLAKQRVGARGRVVGVDRAPGMLAVARSVDPTIDWREGDAASLPLEEGERFDVVFCHQGLQFFADKQAAISGMRNALAPGGRIVIGVWRAVEESEPLHALTVAAERVVGSVNDARYSYGDESALEQLLAGAGFTRPSVEKVERTVRFADARTFVQLNAHALVAMSASAASMSDGDKAAATAQIVEESLPLMAPFTDAQGVAVPSAANIAVAHR